LVYHGFQNKQHDYTTLINVSWAANKHNLDYITVWECLLCFWSNKYSPGEYKRLDSYESKHCSEPVRVKAHCSQDVPTWLAWGGCSWTPSQRPWSWTFWQPSSCPWLRWLYEDNDRCLRPERGCKDGLWCHHQCSERRNKKSTTMSIYTIKMLWFYTNVTLEAIFPIRWRDVKLKYLNNHSLAASITSSQDHHHLARFHKLAHLWKTWMWM